MSEEELAGPDLAGEQQLTTVRAQQRALQARLMVVAASGSEEEVALLQYELTILGGEEQALKERAAPTGQTGSAVQTGRPARQRTRATGS
jgi:hypothetical protein